MDISLGNAILAIITTSPEKTTALGAPVFICSSREEMEKVAFTIGKVLGAMVHDLENGVYIIVRH